MTAENTCPDLARWLEFLRDEVPAGDRPVLESHLRHCADCEEQVGFLKEVEGVSRTEWKAPPRAVVERALRIPRMGATPHRWEAQLTHDSSELAGTGVRQQSVFDRDVRKVWRAGPYEVEVRLEFIDERQVLVTGQLQPVSGPVEVTLLRAGATVKQARTDELGQFLLDANELGQIPHSLILQLSATEEIEIPLD